MSSVGVVIPHVPIDARRNSLANAVGSVLHQTHQPDEVHVSVDNLHRGPGHTRTRGLMACGSEWTVYLDDDDWLDQTFIERCLDYAEQTQADLVYPWFRVQSGSDPFPMFFGKPWDDNDPHIFPITYLVRTSVAKEAGGFPSQEQLGEKWAEQWNGESGGEDWYALLQLIEIGAKIVHLPEILWTWNHGGHHFSGRTW